MEQLNEFMVNNYIWITIVCLFLIFTLIGYMADKSKNKNSEPKEQKKVKPASIVKNEEVKEIVNNGVDATNKEENVKNESVTDVEIPTQIEENISIENEVDEPQFEEPVTNTEEVSVEPVEEPKQKSLEELMAENDISETSVVSNEKVETETQETTIEQPTEQNNDEETKESVNEEIPKDAEVVNAWEPELTVENKDIVPENDDVEKDSK